MAQVITGIGGHYELEEVEFSRVYIQVAARDRMLECTCEKRTNLSIHGTSCEGCVADHAAVIREWLGPARQLEEDEIYPWRYTEHSEEDELPL